MHIGYTRKNPNRVGGVGEGFEDIPSGKKTLKILDFLVYIWKSRQSKASPWEFQKIVLEP